MSAGRGRQPVKQLSAREPGQSVRPATRSAVRFWGWHRLRTRSAADLVRQAAVSPGDLVLDLGAGDGAITGPLVTAGARVVAAELHPHRLHRLQARFGRTPPRDRIAPGSVQILRVDVLRLGLPAQPFRVVSNPPWSVAKQLLRRLTGANSALVQADLVLPRGIVLDLAARQRTGAYDRFRTSAAAMLEPHAFRPAPPRPAAVLRLRRLTTR